MVGLDTRIGDSVQVWQNGLVLERIGEDKHGCLGTGSRNTLGSDQASRMHMLPVVGYGTWKNVSMGIRCAAFSSLTLHLR